jgi:hypothetical protein
MELNLPQAGEFGFVDLEQPENHITVPIKWS